MLYQLYGSEKMVCPPRQAVEYGDQRHVRRDVRGSTDHCSIDKLHQDIGATLCRPHVMLYRQQWASCLVFSNVFVLLKALGIVTELASPPGG